MVELKNCPFCGGTNFFIGSIAEIEMQDEDHPDYALNSQFFAVVCSSIDGGCGASTGASRTEEEAIESWNRRANDEND